MFADTIFVNHIPSLVSIVILISILPLVHYHILSKLNVIYIPSSLKFSTSRGRGRGRGRPGIQIGVMLVRKKETHCYPSITVQNVIILLNLNA